MADRIDTSCQTDSIHLKSLAVIIILSRAWRTRGLARARLFDWHRCAQATAALYRDAASHP